MSALLEKLEKRHLIVGVIGLSVLLLVLLFAAASAGREAPAETTAPTDPPEPTLAANPYGPNDFQFDGDYLTCTAGESLLGIDVSEYQRDIDWYAVREAGIAFAFIRLGYRGNLEGNLYEDAMFRHNLQMAKDAGLKVGAYFFSQAITVEEAIEEAQFAVQLLGGVTLDLPMVYDWEFMYVESRTDDMDGPTMTACTKAFCQTVEKAGYDAMVYFNLNQANHYLDLIALSEYPFWLAMYADRMTYPYKVDFWQYSYTGRVPGIETDVDLNLWFRYDEE